MTKQEKIDLLNKTSEIFNQKVIDERKSIRIHTNAQVIKRLCKDGAFVYYHTGDTAAKTNYRDLYKIENAYAIENLGGTNND